MTAATARPRRSPAPVGEPEDAYFQRVVASGASVRLPGLLRRPPGATLYHRPDRHGVTVVVVPTLGLREGDLDALLRFRFAQYLQVGFVDRARAYAERMSAEPASQIGPSDVHIVAGAPATGEILCYAVLEQPPSASPDTRLRSAGRPLLPVERVHGAGIYNRLPILPDLALHKVRELGRFVRNHRPASPKDRRTRAVVELGAALFQLMAGPLRFQVDAVVGDLEEQVAKQNLDFFHVPSVVLHGTVPYLPSASYLHPRYVRRTVYPFACLTSELDGALERLAAVENALSLPGMLGLLALLRLKRQTRGPAPSMLRPDTPPAPLDELSPAQPEMTMPERARLLEQAAWLRRCDIFAQLSVAEAAMLCTLMEPVRLTAGQAVYREGAPGDALYLIESGQARIEVSVGAGDPEPAGVLGPGQCCGHQAVLSDGEHCASVVATTDMTVLRLSKQDHDTYVSGLPDVGTRLARHALHQWAHLHRFRQRTRSPASTHDSCGCGDACSCEGHRSTNERMS